MNLSTHISRRVLVVTAMIAVSIMAYALVAKARAVSYAKTEPYTVNVTIEAVPGATVFLSYDYGYGIRDEHIRRLVVGDSNNEFTLSLSAWKRVQALYFIAPKATPYKVTQLRLMKNGVEFYPDLPTNGATLEGDNWLVRLPLTGFNY